MQIRPINSRQDAKSSILPRGRQDGVGLYFATPVASGQRQDNSKRNANHMQSALYMNSVTDFTFLSEHTLWTKTLDRSIWNFEYFDYVGEIIKGMAPLMLLFHVYLILPLFSRTVPQIRPLDRSAPTMAQTMLLIDPLKCAAFYKTLVRVQNLQKKKTYNCRPRPYFHPNFDRIIVLTVRDRRIFLRDH